MTNARRIANAVGAIALLAAFVVGVPFVLVNLVGNPWPGRTRLELRDEVGVLVGVLAVVAWLVWARFVLAVVGELRDQLATLRVEARRDPAARIEVVAPAPARGGIGLLAQRLVAAALIILPIATRSAPAIGGAPAELSRARPTAALVVDREPAPRPAPPKPAQPAGDGWVVVAPGDTLIGLARVHLGDAGRWREIFDLNRDRPQVDGGRLATPSQIRPGWRLRLPAPAVVAERGPYLAAETITIEPGDNLWNLSSARLARGGLAHDDADVVAHVEDVIAANVSIVEDPDLIYPGEQFVFPAVGTPPSRPPAHPPNEEREAPASRKRGPCASRRTAGGDAHDCVDHHHHHHDVHVDHRRTGARAAHRAARRRAGCAGAGRPLADRNRRGDDADRRRAGAASPPAAGCGCARRNRGLACRCPLPIWLRPNAGCARSTPASGSCASTSPCVPRPLRCSPTSTTQGRSPWSGSVPTATSS